MYNVKRMIADLKKLKSGTDIRGTAVGNNADLTTQAIAALSMGFAVYLKEAFKKDKNAPLKIALGHDSRISAEKLCHAVFSGLKADNCEVLFFGLCSTPAMFMSTVLNGCDGAIMLTASHHPSDKNGMKFFTKNGGVTSPELDIIIERSNDINLSIVNRKSSINLESYCAHMRNIFIEALGENPLKGYKIAVDAGNGAAGFYAERILKPLGADISGSQFLEPDGTFPNHEPNPENKAAMASFAARVLETKSDLGVIFDTDGDRAAIVLSDGKEINRNRLIALISAIIIGQEKLNNQPPHIVTDSVTSEGLKEFITALGGVHIRYKRGYQNVIGYAKKLNAEGKYAPLAIETSGHAALKENYFLDDGAYLAAKIIVKAVQLKRQSKDLYSLIKDLKEPAEELSLRLNLTGENWKNTAQTVLNALNEFSKAYRIAEDSFEGIRTYLLNGWFMARISVHDPVIPINIECDKKGGCKKIAELLYDALKGIEGVDLSALK